MEVDGSVLALFVGAGRYPGDVLGDGRFHWPDEGMNGTQHENRCLFVPARVAQNFAGVFGRVGLEGPGGVGAEFRGNAELAEERL